MPSSTDRRQLTYLASAYLLLLFVVFSYRWVPLQGSMRSTISACWKAGRVSEIPLVPLRYYNSWTDSDSREYCLYANLMLGLPVASSEIAHLDESRGDVGGLGNVLRVPPTYGTPLMPYRDFVVEYPPLVLPILLLPRLLGEGPAYATGFSLQMALIHLLTLLLAFQATRHLPFEDGAARLLRGTFLALLALGPLVTSRLDALAGLLLILCLLAAMRSRPTAAGIWLALATAAKLFPVFLAPLMTLHWCRKRDSLRFVAAFTLATALIFGPALWYGGDRFWAGLRYHAQRPVQVESMASTLGMVWSVATQSPVSVTIEFGSRNYHGVFEEFLRKICLFVTLAAVGAITLLYGRQVKGALQDHERNALLLRALLAAMLAIVLTSKVFSPQYMMWLIPLIFLVTGPRRHALDRTVLAACLLSQMVYPFLYHGLEHLQGIAVLALLLRNGALLAVLVGLLAPWLMWPKQQMALEPAGT